MCEIFTAHTEILLVLKQKQFSVYCLACDDKYEFIIMQDKKNKQKTTASVVENTLGYILR